MADRAAAVIQRKRDLFLLVGAPMLVFGLCMTNPWLILALFGALFIWVWWVLP